MQSHGNRKEIVNVPMMGLKRCVTYQGLRLTGHVGTEMESL